MRGLLRLASLSLLEMNLIIWHAYMCACLSRLVFLDTHVYVALGGRKNLAPSVGNRYKF